MATGTLALTCWMLIAGAAPIDVWPMNQRSFQIPIKVDPTRSRSDFKQFILFTSNDQGKSWHEEAVATPDKDVFTFFAPSDGIYWFSVVSVDQKDQKEPANVSTAPPGLKILVDTEKPTLRIVSAERHGDEIVVSWDLQEQNPDLATLKLEYQTADSPPYQWSPVTVNQATSGQVPFRVPGSAAVSIKMQVQDQAGNVGSAQTQVAAAASPLTPTGATTASFTTPSAVPSVPPPVPSASGPSLPGSQWEHLPPAPVHPEPRAPAGYTSTPWTGAADSGTRLVASAEATPAAAPALPPAAAHPGRGTLPPLRVVNTPQVSLEYEVAKFGPSGVGSVELYLTRDDGVSWQRFATDSDLKPATAADLAGLAPTLRRTLAVELPGEGIYGFYLVVHSGAGLGKPPPQNGEAPQMRVEVDTTRPAAQLFAPEAIPGQRDALLISWTATDRNLAPNPITLQWAERQGGPWETIGVDLPNSGRFTWKLPPNLPYRVFLRLTVRDTAGNASVAETREPVLVDLSEPEGRLVDIAGPGRR